jgi:transcriptional regulator with XRE-family HTH domain
MEQLAAALRQHKEENQLSLRAFASELGVQHGTAESWLKGWRKPHYRHLPRIVETLHIDELTIYRWLTEDEETRENSG